MKNRITDLDPLTIELDPAGAIETYIWEEIVEGSWSEVGQIVSHLESASCASGSWSGMIYTRDIQDKLADSQWVDDINQAIEEYSDATGESPTFDPYGSGFSLENTVTFAVDWVAQRLASRLRAMGKVAVVTASTDSLDPFPDVIAFASIEEASDWASDEVQRRLDHIVSHSLTVIDDDEYARLEDAEWQLFAFNEERL